MPRRSRRPTPQSTGHSRRVQSNVRYAHSTRFQERRRAWAPRSSISGRRSRAPLSGAAGEIIVCDSRSLVVACGHGALELRCAQRAGGNRCSGGRVAEGFVSRPAANLGPQLLQPAKLLEITKRFPRSSPTTYWKFPTIVVNCRTDTHQLSQNYHTIRLRGVDEPRLYVGTLLALAARAALRHGGVRWALALAFVIAAPAGPRARHHSQIRAGSKQ